MLSAPRYILCVVLLIFSLCVVPIVNLSDSVDDNASEIAKSATINFVKLVQSKGYLDNRDYLDYLAELDSSGVVFDVTLEYYKKRYQPLYGDPNDYYTFTNKFETYYDGYFTKDILNKLFPNNGTAEDDPSRRFNMQSEDLFEVRISSKGVDVTSRVKTLLMGSTPTPINFSYGGAI